MFFIYFKYLFIHLFNYFTTCVPQGCYTLGRLNAYSLRCEDPVAISKEVDIEASDADASSSDSGPSSEEGEAEADDAE